MSLVLLAFALRHLVLLLKGTVPLFLELALAFEASAMVRLAIHGSRKHLSRYRKLAAGISARGDLSGARWEGLECCGCLSPAITGDSGDAAVALNGGVVECAAAYSS